MKVFKLEKSPFLPEDRVYVSRGKGAYENTVSVLQNIDLSPAQGKKVLLKPNAGRIAEPGKGVTTDPQVVAAVIDKFRDAGADVAIGESPISGVRTMEAFEATGISAVANERDCPLIDMDARAFVEVPIPHGIAICSLKLCSEIFEYDIIVSIPVMKMHMHTGVTLAVKNMKGCLWRRSKVDLHMLPPVDGWQDKPINIAIADMSWVLRPHLSVIDGSTGMEGLGPSAGKPKPLGIIVAGADPFSTDAVACRLMGVNAEDVPHLSIAAKRGFGVIDLDRIQVMPDNWREWISPFEHPPTNLAIEFPQFRIMDENSCSACQSTLLLFLKRYGQVVFDYFPEGFQPCFAIGKGHDSVPQGTFCIGNCTARNRKSGVFIPGCPPVGSEILSAITGKPSIDTEDGHSHIPDQAVTRHVGGDDEH